MARSPGSETSRRLPPTSTTTVCRGALASSSSAGSAAWNGSIGLSNSVSIQRVWTDERLVAARRRERRVVHDRAVERQHGRHALDDDLGQRPARARRCACARSSPVTMSLAEHRVELRRRSRCRPRRPESTRTPGPSGATKPGDRAGRGQEAAAGVLAVDPELDGVPARRRVLGRTAAPRPRRCGTARAPGRCPLVSSETGCSTCSRVLTSRNEIVPVLADEELDGARAASSRPRRRCLGRAVDRACAARRSGTAPAPPRRASGGGAAASSRGCRRRCTLPCWSARTCASTCRGRSR